MSRMEKFHHIKKEEEEELTVSHNHQDGSNTPKKKSRHPFRKLVKGLLVMSTLLLLLVSGAFFLGFLSAKTDSEIKQIAVNEFNGVASPDGSINVLLLGSDSRGEDLGRADSIMVAHYNKHSKTPKIISFMRDTYVSLPGQGMNKLNAAYAFGGPELVRETLKETFDIDIQYYAVVNFEAFSKIIDGILPQGLLLNVEKEMTVEKDHLTAGWQHLDGHQVLQYARFRKDEESDFGRVRRQQQVMNGLVDQSLTLKGSFHFPSAFGKAMGYTTTNIPKTLLPTLVLDATLGRIKRIEKLSVPVADSWWDNDYPGVGSVLEINQEMNQSALHQFLNS